MKTKQKNKLMIEFINLICIKYDTFRKMLKLSKQADYFSSMSMEEELQKTEQKMISLNRFNVLNQTSLSIIEQKIGFFENVLKPLIDKNTGIIQN